VVRTDLRSSSIVVAGAAATSAATAAGVATGTAGAATEVAAGTAAVAALRPAFFTSAAATTGAGAATTGAGAGAATSSVFLATRLALVAEEAVEEFIILVPVEEFISIKRTIPTLSTRTGSIFMGNPSISPPGLTRGTFFFERSPGYDGVPDARLNPQDKLRFSLLRHPGFILKGRRMEVLELRKCANIKSKKHKDQPCPLTASHGEYCSRHYKNPMRYLQESKVLPERVLTRSGHAAVQRIQRVWRKIAVFNRFRRQGPAANFRDIASNQTEVYSLDSLDSIPQSFFFSFADTKKNVWAFDIRSLSHLVTEGSEIVNPYTRGLIDSSVLQKIHARIVWLRERKYPILYAIGENLTQEQVWNQKVLDVFFKMEALGYRASCRWFDAMNLTDHMSFYRKLHRLWMYQLGLTPAEKEAIIPGYNAGLTKLFKQTPDRLETQNHDLRWWRRANLNLILEFLCRAPQKSQQGLGALYILMALVQVVPEAAEAYPWVREALGY